MRKLTFQVFALLSLVTAGVTSACDRPLTQDTATATATSSATAGPASTPIGVFSQSSPKLEPVVVETTAAQQTGNFTSTRTINLPPGFGIKLFATGLQHVRQMAFSPDGVLYASVRAEDRVVRLPDANKDGVADEAQTVAGDMDGVHGVAFRNGVLYAATEAQVIRLVDTNGDGVADKKGVIVDDMPVGGVGDRATANHTTRTIIFGPDDNMYVAMGSDCNACVEKDPRRAAISQYTPDGQFLKVYASGLRNSVGILFHPVTGELWAVNNGRDGLGEDLPPEGVYKVKEGGNYGWPFCYGYRVPDKEMAALAPPKYCEGTDVPEFTLPAHLAPLGLAFYTGNRFPAEYSGDMFIASHGSWDRKIRRGYELMRVRFKDNEPDRSSGDVIIEDFATGWLLDPVSGQHWGRPVDPVVGPDGAIYLTDDASMSIYKIYYKNNR